MAYKKWEQGFPHQEGLLRAWCAGPAVCIHPVYKTLGGRSVCLGRQEETKQRGEAGDSKSRGCSGGAQGGARAWAGQQAEAEATWMSVSAGLACDCAVCSVPGKREGERERERERESEGEGEGERERSPGLARWFSCSSTWSATQ